jgi:hypothetical protein
MPVSVPQRLFAKYLCNRYLGFRGTNAVPDDSGVDMMNVLVREHLPMSLAVSHA